MLLKTNLTLNMKKQILNFAAIMLLAAPVFAQTTTTETATSEFKPSGKASGRVFFNFHHFYKGATPINAFEIQRAYLGYTYNFSEAITGKVVLDGARKSEASEYTAFLKIAQLDWKLNDKALLSMGMIGLKQFDTQEKFWGYRYVYKDFQDEFGFGTSADLGCNLEYTFSPKVMANLFVVNGEGFTRVQDSNGKIKVGGSVVYEPVKGLLLKGYYSNYSGQQANAAGELRDTAAIQNYEVFAGYKTEKFRVGVGYNIQENGKSFYQVAEDYKMQGFSLSGAYAINKKYELFAQVMNYQSNTLSGATDSWDHAKDGSIYMGGIQYMPTKGIKTALNYRYYAHDDNAVSDVEAVYLNLEFLF